MRVMHYLLNTKKYTRVTRNSCGYDDDEHYDHGDYKESYDY